MKVVRKSLLSNSTPCLWIWSLDRVVIYLILHILFSVLTLIRFLLSNFFWQILIKITSSNSTYTSLREENHQKKFILQLIKKCLSGCWAVVYIPNVLPVSCGGLLQRRLGHGRNSFLGGAIATGWRIRKLAVLMSRRGLDSGPLVWLVDRGFRLSWRGFPFTCPSKSGIPYSPVNLHLFCWVVLVFVELNDFKV